MGVHHHKAPIVTDGLVFQIDSNNNIQGGTANNLTTPTEIGTLTNGVSIVNGEYDFDGVDDYINYGAPYIWHFDFNDTFTIDCWIKNIGDGTENTIISSRADDSVRRGVNFSITGGDKVAFNLINSVPSNLRIVATNTNTTIIDNVWYNVSITYDGSTLASGVTHYVNGSDDGQTVFIDTLGSNTTIEPTTIGVIGSIEGTNTFFKGNIASVKIYDRVLTADEVTQNYESQKHRFE